MITRIIANLAMILTVGSLVVILTEPWITQFHYRFLLAWLVMGLFGWPFRWKEKRPQ